MPHENAALTFSGLPRLGAKTPIKEPHISHSRKAGAERHLLRNTATLGTEGERRGGFLKFLENFEIFLLYASKRRRKSTSIAKKRLVSVASNAVAGAFAPSFSMLKPRRPGSTKRPKTELPSKECLYCTGSKCHFSKISPPHRLNWSCNGIGAFLGSRNVALVFFPGVSFGDPGRAFVLGARVFWFLTLVAQNCLSWSVEHFDPRLKTVLVSRI